AVRRGYRSTTVLLSSLPTRVLATATSALAVQAGLQIAAPLSSVSDTNMHRAPQRAHSSADRSAAMNEPGKSKTNNNKTATKGKSKSKSFPLTRTSRLIEGGWEEPALSEVEGISRGPAPRPEKFLREIPSPAKLRRDQDDAPKEGRRFKIHPLEVAQ